MKGVLLILIFFTTFSYAQDIPKFKNDTLHTSCGYKIYKGQVLHLAGSEGSESKFRFIKFRKFTSHKKLRGKSVIVTRISDFYISGLENYYIRIHGTYINRKGKNKRTWFKLLFEKAIGGYQGIAPEIIVPNEYRFLNRLSAADEIEKLHKLYQKGIISKEEFEKQKKRILDN